MMYVECTTDLCESIKEVFEDLEDAENPGVKRSLELEEMLIDELLEKTRYRRLLKALKKQLKLQVRRGANSNEPRIPIEDQDVPTVLKDISELILKHVYFKVAALTEFEDHVEVVLSETQGFIRKMA